MSGSVTPTETPDEARPTRADLAGASRTAILATAQRLFEKHGFTLITLRQIAGEVRMSTGALFGHFPDGKDALFKAAFPTDFRRLRMAEAMCDAFHFANVWPNASSATRDRWLAAADAALARPAIAQSIPSKAA